MFFLYYYRNYFHVFFKRVTNPFWVKIILLLIRVLLLFMLVLFVVLFVLMMLAPFLFIMVFFIITTFILCIWTLSNKMSYFSIIKPFKGKLTFVFVISFFEFSYNCASSASDSQLEKSLDSWSLFFVFLEALKVSSLFDGFSFSVLISYDVRTPCNSYIVN